MRDVPPLHCGAHATHLGRRLREVLAGVLSDRRRDVLAGEPLQVSGVLGWVRVCLCKELAVMVKAVSMAVVKQSDLEVVGEKATMSMFVRGLSASISGGAPGPGQVRYVQ